MHILERIIKAKIEEVRRTIEMIPVKRLEKSIHFDAPTVSLRRYLEREDLHGVIAEIKRKSPSKGILNPHISVEELSIGYMQSGASALSVLTDREFFGGSNEDLSVARKFNYCPILRKDFIVDEYQVIESKSIGADVILLIAGAVLPERLKQLARRARELGLEVLLEVHREEDLEDTLCDDISLVGVNNRDLRDFSVDVQRSFDLVTKIPSNFTKISESGLHDPAVVRSLRQAGYRGFLIGEQFMKCSKPERACRRFIQELAAA
jgi:indole-3-glycerol phosphate synthase